MDGGLHASLDPVSSAEHAIRGFVNRYLRFDPILTPNVAVRVR
jgi:hypothetical protein